MRRPRLVTLTSDIGSVYAAQVKAVLHSRLPPGHVVELADDLTPHGIEEGAFLLEHLAARFPPGTVHLVIVDPGVGGARAPIAVRCSDGSVLVGPDNGVLAPLADRLGKPEARRILRERVTEPGATASATFDGRDLFAPAAARLAGGMRFDRVGPRQPLHRLATPNPRRGSDRLVGTIRYIDRFGNLISDLASDWVPSKVNVATVRLGRRRAFRVPRVRFYEELGRGRVGLLGSSFGTLEVSVREGSAERTLRARAGERVEVAWTIPKRR